MITSVKPWPFATLALSATLSACSGSNEPPEAAATTTTTVQNRKAQPAHDSQIRQLDAVQLGTFFSDEKIRGLSPDGRKWNAVFEANGKASIIWDGPKGKGADTGTWKIDGNTNCVTWQTLNDGEQDCMTVYKVDHGQYNLFNENGSFNSLITVFEF